MLLYGISRFVIEFFRGDERGDGVWRHLDLAVHLAAARARSAIGMLMYLSRRTPIRCPCGARGRTAGRRDADTDARGRAVEVGGRPGGRTARPVSRRRPARPLAIAGTAADRAGPRARRGPAGARQPGGARPATASPSTFPAPAPATPEAEDIPLPVLYEDADLIVVNKPAGMVVHPAAGHASGTLVNALLHHVRRPQRHRRRVAARHRPPAGQGHVGRDGRRQARRGARGAGAAVRGARGREGVHRAGLGRRAGGTSDRSADRTRPERPAEDVGARPPRAIGGDAHHAGAAPARRHAVPGRDRHRPHASDPRAPQRHRPSDRRRCHVRRRTGARGRRPPARARTRPARSSTRCRLAFTHPTDGRPMQFEAPLAPDLQHVLDELEALQESMGSWGPWVRRPEL